VIIYVVQIALKKSLLALGQNWQAWVIWYEDRVDGRVGVDERELAYVRIEEMFWQQGHAEVNAEVMRRLEELAIPEQEPLATRFGVNSQGLIDVVPDPPAHRTSDDALQREIYDETREKAEILLGYGHNQLGDLVDPITRFPKKSSC
jgi:hypothetical protein